MLSLAFFRSHHVSRMIFVCALLSAFLWAVNGAFAVNGKMSDGGRYMEELGVCSFTPPEGWVLWDYYGLDVFSPTENKDIRLSLIAVESPGETLHSESSDEVTATDLNESSPPLLKKEVKGFENTFSEPDFELLSLEKRELEGYPGVEVCARATVDNELFPDTIIHIVQYYTPTHIVTMTLRCPPSSLDEYQNIIKSAVESIDIILPPGEDISPP